MTNSAASHSGDSSLGGGLSGWPHTQFQRRRLAVEFTGSGSEYFRIWIVNMALCLLTLGLYWPFAKARRLRYFYANTVIDGQPLAFHGDPKLMFRGFALLAGLWLAYALANRFAPLLGLVAVLALAALAPALFHAAQCFRLQNTSWRGLRFGFTGTRIGAYRAMLPLALSGVPMLALLLVFNEQLQQTDAATSAPALAVVATMLLFYSSLPWVLARLKRYQHGHLAYAGLRSESVLSNRAVYLLAVKTLGLGLLCGLLAMVLMLVGAQLGILLGHQAWSLPVLLLAYLAVFSLLTPFVQARLQNLVWSGTSAPGLQFESSLSWRDLALLTFQSWLLTALTLGLFRPFAAVNLARLRLEMVSLMIDGDPIDWVAQHRQSGAPDASGDAAADLFGLDVGL